MSSNPCFWPGDSEVCIEPNHPPDCDGPGGPRHIQKWLHDEPSEDLLGIIKGCCSRKGEDSFGPSEVRSCFCMFAARELERRGEYRLFHWEEYMEPAEPVEVRSYKMWGYLDADRTFWHYATLYCNMLVAMYPEKGLPGQGYAPPKEKL